MAPVTSPEQWSHVSRCYRFVALRISFSMFLVQAVEPFWSTQSRGAERLQQTAAQRVSRHLRLRTSGMLWVSSSRPPKKTVAHCVKTKNQATRVSAAMLTIVKCTSG